MMGIANILGQATSRQDNLILRGNNPVRDFVGYRFRGNVQMSRNISTM